MTESISNPHDKFFRELISRPGAAAEIARQTLPAEVLAQLDLSQPQVQDDSWVDEDLRAHFADAVYKVPYLNSPDSAYLVILFEHKSHPEPFVAFQVLRYMVQAWRHHLQTCEGPLPVVIPLVLYHGSEKWNVARSFEALFNQTIPGIKDYLPKFEYALLDLSVHSNVEIHGDAAIKAALELMRAIFRKDFQERLVEVLKDLPLGQVGVINWLETMLIYVVAARQVPEPELAQTLIQAFPGVGERKVIQFIEDWKNEGRFEGRVEGRVEGLRQGVVRQLRRKFRDQFETSGRQS